MSMRLVNGSRVGIVGGGPSGSFAALHLLQFAKQQKLQLEVLIFEPRDFTRPGPGGCNRCAGILSAHLQDGLSKLGLSLPNEVIQAELNAYTAVIGGETVQFEQPEPERRIVSVYRGGGPRLVQGKPVASFDAFLLSQACTWGAQHINKRVRQITRQDKPIIHTAWESFPIDLLVLATGVNSRAPVDESFRYRPPKTEVMAQDEFIRPPGWPRDQVQIYFRQPPGLIFGALIPKGDYLNISLLGFGLPTDAVSSFLDAQNLSGQLQPSGSLCGCSPRISVSTAGHFFGNQWVSVGDAAVTRLYKDGIGSALKTARVAMQTAIEEGVSIHSFRNRYAPFCREIAIDNIYGHLLFRIWAVVLHSHASLEIWKRMIQKEMYQSYPNRIHTRILWGMLTGEDRYKDLFRMFTSLPSFRNILHSLLPEKQRQPLA